MPFTKTGGYEIQRHLQRCKDKLNQPRSPPTAIVGLETGSRPSGCRISHFAMSASIPGMDKSGARSIDEPEDSPWDLEPPPASSVSQCGTPLTSASHLEAKDRLNGSHLRRFLVSRAGLQAKQCCSSEAG